MVWWGEYICVHEYHSLLVHSNDYTLSQCKFSNPEATDLYTTSAYKNWEYAYNNTRQKKKCAYFIEHILDTCRS